MKSIRTKVLTLVITSVLISIFSISVIALTTSTQVAADAAEEILALKCETKRLEIDSQLEKIEQAVNTIYFASIKEISNLVRNNVEWSAPEFQSMLGEMERLTRNVSQNTDGAIVSYVRLFNPETKDSTGFLLSKNMVSSAFESLEITDIGAYDADDIEHVGWYWIPIRAGLPVWIDPYYNRNLDINMISYVIPIFISRKPVGVVGMDIDINLIKRTVASLEVYDSGDAFLADSKENIIYHKLYPDGCRKEDFNMVYYQKPSKNQARVGQTVDYTSNGQRRRMYTKRLRNKMFLVITAPVYEIEKHRGYLIIRTMVALLVIMAVVIPFTAGFGIKISRPLMELTRAAAKVAKGDMSVNITSSTEDEVGLLAQTFGHTVQELRKYVGYMNRLAYVDVLTGLKNKTAYTEDVSLLKTKVSSGEVESFCVIVMDVNNLKKVNDNHGHVTGDLLIMNAAIIMSKAFENRKVYRIGGDEFVVILENISISHVEQFLENFDNEVQSFNDEKSMNPDFIPIHIARGAAGFDSATDQTYEEVFNQADTNMYKHKQIMKGICEDC